MQITYIDNGSTKKPSYSDNGVTKKTQWFGRLANGVVTNAVDQYIDIPYGSAIDFGIQSNFTFSIICNPRVLDGQNAYRFFNKHGINYGLQMDWASNVVYFLIRKVSNDTLWGISVNLSSTLITQKLVTLDFVKYNASPGTSISPTEWKVYFNGVEITSGFTTYTSAALTPATVITENAPIHISLRGPNFYSGIIINDVKIYSRNLSSVETLAKFNKEGRWFTSDHSEVLNYPFKEKNGKVVNDESGSGLHGSLINYTNVETANAGQPQAGNTAWVDAYSLIPIIV